MSAAKSRPQSQAVVASFFDSQKADGSDGDGNDRKVAFMERSIPRERFEYFDFSVYLCFLVLFTVITVGRQGQDIFWLAKQARDVVGHVLGCYPRVPGPRGGRVVAFAWRFPRVTLHTLSFEASFYTPSCGHLEAELAERELSPQVTTHS